MGGTPLLDRLKKWDRRLSFGVEVVSSVLLAAIVGTVSVSVFTRFVIFFPLNFADALAKYLMMWMVFLGLGLALRAGEHITVEFLANRLRGNGKSAMLALVTLLVSIFLMIVAYYGFRNAWNGRDVHDPLVFGISMMVPYLSVPVGACYGLMQLNLSLSIDILESRAETTTAVS
jgi:TRAP-type C4-dicarboxylate transport system permease small subunit